ncbi:MAG: hypothetical protein KAQ81_11515 [Deltaproteobacteria bacterium]|nr:hypothetical protein [Deltaproteobacteria bacterium]
MNEQVEINKKEDGIVELRYFDRPNVSSPFSWKIPIQEADDLAKWWLTDGVQIRKEDVPVLNRRCGRILISMFTSSFVEVRVLNQYGKLKLRGYSLPVEVVENVASWMRNGQCYLKSSNEQRDARCSTKC